MILKRIKQAYCLKHEMQYVLGRRLSQLVPFFCLIVASSLLTAIIMMFFVLLPIDVGGSGALSTPKILTLGVLALLLVLLNAFVLWRLFLRPVLTFLSALAVVSDERHAVDLNHVYKLSVSPLTPLFNQALHAVQQRCKIRDEERISFEEQATKTAHELQISLDSSQRAHQLLFAQQRVLSLIATSPPIAQSLATVASVYQDVFADACCLIFTLDHDSLVLATQQSKFSDEEEPWRIPLGDRGGFCGMAGHRRQIFTMKEYPITPGTDLQSIVDEAELVDGWARPIVSQRGRLYGVMVVGYRRDREPDKEELKFSDMLCDFAAIAFEKARAHAELLATRDQAERAVRAKADFLANMSHEIRTPMNGVVGLTELVLDLKLSDEARVYLEMIRDSSHSLMQIINDILDFSKAEAHRIQLEQLDFDLHWFIERTLAVLSIRARERDLVFVSKIEKRVPRYIRGDMTRFGQILNNLVSNAIKFTNSSGAVIVYVDAPHCTATSIDLCCAVSDTGIGIPDDKIETIFELFTQADASTTRRYGGTGLGLSISRQLVTLMGGQIWCRSRVGEGSAFHFQIVVEPAQNIDALAEGMTSPISLGIAHSPSISLAAQRTDFNAQRFLVADDNPVNLLLVRRLLEARGGEVVAVDNGGAVLEQLQLETFDLVILDCHMPIIDGFQAARSIRDSEAQKQDYSSIPIIALSADTSEEHKERCLMAGMNSYISKPFKKDELYEVVSKYVRLKE